VKWGYDPMHKALRSVDHVREVESSLFTRRIMSTTQLIIVAVLSLAVVALLMVRQRQTN
jgi:hypothetical protein